MGLPLDSKYEYTGDEYAGFYVNWDFDFPSSHFFSKKVIAPFYFWKNLFALQLMNLARCVTNEFLLRSEIMFFKFYKKSLPLFSLKNWCRLPLSIVPVGEPHTFWPFPSQHPYSCPGKDYFLNKFYPYPACPRYQVFFDHPWKYDVSSKMCRCLCKN